MVPVTCHLNANVDVLGEQPGPALEQRGTRWRLARGPGLVQILCAASLKDYFSDASETTLRGGHGSDWTRWLNSVTHSSAAIRARADERTRSGSRESQAKVMRTAIANSRTSRQV